MASRASAFAASKRLAGVPGGDGGGGGGGGDGGGGGFDGGLDGGLDGGRGDPDKVGHPARR